MAGTNLGTAWIQIKPTTTGITSAVKKELAGVEKETVGSGSKLSGAFSSLGKKAGQAFKVGLLAASASAVAGVVTMTKSAVAAFADYEQLVGGVDTLFKGASDQVQQYASNAFKTAQMSANEYMETVTSFSASLIQSLGGDTDKAAKYADQAIIDMADNANKMGTNIEMIQNAYQGFAKQNYTMLDNLKLGYGGTKTEMERLLKDAEKISGMKFEMGNFADMTQAIHIIQENLGIAGTSASEASETITGSLNSMKAAWNNLMVGMADGSQNMDALIENFVSSAGDLGKNILPTIQTAIKGAADMIGKLLPEIISAIPGIIKDALPSIIQATTSVISSLASALPSILKELLGALVDAIPMFVNTIVESIPMFIDGLMQLLDGLIQAFPTIIPQLIQAITTLITTLATQLTRPDFLSMILKAALTLFMEVVKAIPQMLVSLIEALPTIITNIVSFLIDPENIMMIIAAAVELFFGLVSAVPQILGALIGAFGDLVGNLWNGIKDMFGNFAANFGKFITDIFKGAINGMISFIENFLNTPINLINGFLDIINGAFGWLGVNIGKIELIKLPRLASGGIVQGVGTDTSDSNLYALSKGEYVIRAAAARDIGYDNLNRMNETGEVSGGNQTVNITINGYNKSPEELANIISRRIAFNQRGVIG